MRPLHLIFALLITFVWGCNFVFVALGLTTIPPLLLCALRFFLASIPGVFFIKKPDVPLKYILLYSMFTFALQFGLMFMGMKLGMPPGLTSLVAQLQVFFSLLLAIVLLNERPDVMQLIGSAVGFAGIVLVGLKIEGNIAFSGFLLVVIGSAAWGFGNLMVKKIGNVNPLALVAWGCFFAFPPMLFASLCIEGMDKIIETLHHLSLSGIVATLYIAYFSTWFGYGVWGWLLNKYSVSTIVPFTLLVPIFGMLCSVIFFDEPLEAWKLIAAGCIFVGLTINTFGQKWFAILKKNQSVLSGNTSEN